MHIFFYITKLLLQIMKPIAKSLDILQGDKIVLINYLIPILTLKKSLNNRKSTEILYTTS
jgi:hypothetical protein